MKKELIKVEEVMEVVAKSDSEKREERKAIMIKRMADSKVEAESYATIYNKFVDEDPKKSKDAEAKIDEAVKEYLASSKCLAYENIVEKSSDKTEMAINAVKELKFDIIRKKITRKNDDGNPQIEVEIVEDKRVFNMLDFNKYANGVGADDKWSLAIEKLNRTLTASTAIDLEIDPESVYDSYNMKKLAKEIELSACNDRIKSPISNNSMTKLLDQIAKMLFGDKAPVIRKKDIAYLKMIYAKKSNKETLTVCCPNHRDFMKMLTELFHAALLEKDYGIEFKKEKDKAEEPKTKEVEVAVGELTEIVEVVKVEKAEESEAEKPKRRGRKSNAEKAEKSK